jgi:PAS domain S-box-containing protein
MLAGFYFAASTAALLAATRHGVASSFWLPAGIALFALVRFGLGLWPGVALGALLTSTVTGAPLAFVVGAAAGKSLEAIVGASLLLRVFEFRATLDRLPSVLALAFAACTSAVVGATFGVSAALASGLVAADTAGARWALWWSGDAIGMLVTTPLLLAWTTPPDPAESARWRSAAGLVLLGGLLAALVLLLRGDADYVYGVFLIITGLAFHFGRRAVTTAVAIAAGLATWQTLQGVGAFVTMARPNDLLLLQVFGGLLPLTSLLITAGLAERRDVTARLEAQAAQIFAAQQIARFGTWRLDMKPDRVTWSPELFRIFGVDPARLNGSREGVLSLVHPEDQAMVRATVERAIAEGGAFRLHHRFVRADGQVRMLATMGETIGDESGQPLALVGVCQDITEQWRTEAALREREELLRAVFDRSPMGIVLWSLDCRFVRGNRAYLQMMGYTPEEFAGLTIRDITEPDDAARLYPILDQLVRGERQSYEVEKRNLRKDGSRIWVRVSGSTIPDEKGAPRYILGIVENIDQRRRTEAELSRVQEAYREIVEWAPLGVFRSTRDGRILLANRAVGEMLGCRSAAEVRRLDLRRDVTADQGEWDRFVARLEREGRPRRVELEWKKSDGSPIWVELRTHVVRDRGGRVLYFENFVHDITERRRAETVLADEKEILELLARGAGLDEVLDRLCRLAQAWMPGTLCSVHLLEEGTRLRYGAGPSLPSSALAASRGEPVVVEDIERSPLWANYRTLARDAGVRACWSMPIRASDGVVIGTFVMYYREPWRPSVREWQLVERASHLAGLALERSRRRAELERRTAEVQETERRYRMLASQLPDAGVALFDRDLRVVLVEGPAFAAAARSRGEAEGRKVFEITPRLSAERVAAEAGSVFVGESTEFEVEDRHRAYLLRLLPVRDERGSVALGMVLLVDITERRRHERVRRQLLGRVTDAQEQERRRIAREVHDEAGQSLTALLVGLRMLRGAETVEAARAEAARLQEVAAETLENLGRLARGLHPSVLDDMGLPPAVMRYAREYAGHYHIPVTVEVEGFDGRRLPPELEAALYRIVLEALTNTARHSHASHASVQLRHTPGWVEAMVRDDGRGFDVAVALRGDGETQTLGLHGIRERAEFLGGTARVVSSPRRGTVVTVRVPAPT